MSREKIYDECPACGTDLTNTKMATHIHGDCPVLSERETERKSAVTEQP